MKALVKLHGSARSSDPSDHICNKYKSLMCRSIFYSCVFSSSSVLLEDTFGYDKTTASNINGVLYDTALILCPISGHIYVGITLMSNLYN